MFQSGYYVCPIVVESVPNCSNSVRNVRNLSFKNTMGTLSIYRRLNGRTMYFGGTFKNHVFQGCVEELRISAKRSNTTYFNEALRNHVFHRSFFFLKFVVVALNHLKISYSEYALK